MNAIIKDPEATAKEPQYSQRQRAVLDVLAHAADELTRKDIYDRLPKDAGLWSMSEQLGRNQVSKVLCDLFDIGYVAKRSEAGSGCLLWRLVDPVPAPEEEGAGPEPACALPAAPAPQPEAPTEPEPAQESPASWADVVEMSSAAPLGAELPASLPVLELAARDQREKLEPIPHAPLILPFNRQPSPNPLPGATLQASDDLAEAVIAAAVKDQAYWRQPFLEIKRRLNAQPLPAIADYGQKLSLLDGLLDALGSALPPPHLDTLRAIRQDLTNIHNTHQEARRHG